jgi:hypothetical protein
MSVREALCDGFDSLTVARSALEAVDHGKPTKAALESGVKEALEELDYVHEAFTTVAKSLKPQFGRGGNAIWDWIADMEHTGEWDTRMRIEELAANAAHRWEQERQVGRPTDMVQFELAIEQPAVAAYVGPNQNMPPMSMSTQTYRVMIPTACRSKQQAKYVAQCQLEEAFGL